MDSDREISRLSTRNSNLVFVMVCGEVAVLLSLLLYSSTAHSSTRDSDQYFYGRDWNPHRQNYKHVSPNYSYGYSVQSPHTGDVKNQWEKRDGDVVKGSYSVNDPDGTIRQVDYTADKYNGFNAVVKKLGKAVHPNTMSHYSDVYGKIHNSHAPSHLGSSYVSVNRGIDHHLFHNPTTFDGYSFERNNFGFVTSYANGNLHSSPFPGSSITRYLGNKTPHGNDYESAINHYGGPVDSFRDEYGASYFGDFNGREEHYMGAYFHKK